MSVFFCPEKLCRLPIIVIIRNHWKKVLILNHTIDTINIVYHASVGWHPAKVASRIDASLRWHDKWTSKLVLNCVVGGLKRINS
jgi:hypothetical protein